MIKFRDISMNIFIRILEQWRDNILEHWDAYTRMNPLLREDYYVLSNRTVFTQRVNHFIQVLEKSTQFSFNPLLENHITHILLELVDTGNDVPFPLFEDEFDLRIQLDKFNNRYKYQENETMFKLLCPHCLSQELLPYPFINQTRHCANCGKRFKFDLEKVEEAQRSNEEVTYCHHHHYEDKINIYEFDFRHAQNLSIDSLAAEKHRFFY